MTCTWRTFTPTALPKRGTTQVAYSPEELLAGMISGVTGGETKWYDIAVPATMVGGAKKRRRTILQSSGLQVTYTIPFDDMDNARTTGNAKANAAMFAEKSVTKFGALTVMQAPTVMTTVKVQIGTDDEGEMTKMSTAWNDRTTFGAKIAQEMDARGMFIPESNDDDLFFRVRGVGRGDRQCGWVEGTRRSRLRRRENIKRKEK